MSTLFIILAVLMLILGIIGSIAPGLPGPPLSWLGILFAHLSGVAMFSNAFIIITAILAAFITVMDFIIPSWSTKRHGGSKAGVWGCNIGLVLSLFGLSTGPLGLPGIIVWPFVGALAGELIGGKKDSKPLRAAWGAFLGFLAGTGLKLIFGIAMAIAAVVAFF